jgi:pimeloyl-ACP methyl ester carboxylesterase
VGRKILKVIVAILLLGALAIAAAVWMILKRPLTVDAWVSRTALDIQGLETTRLETGAGEMTVWQGGSGPPMVLLHGAGDQAGAWARVVGGLKTDYRLIIPDLPGHWKSDPRTGPIHMAQLLDGVDRTMDSCCPEEPAIIVGNSLGAWLGFLWAREHPDRVARLVAVNGGPVAEPNPQVNLFPQNRDEARETMRGLMGPASPPIPGYVLDDIVRRTGSGPAARFAATAGEMGAFLLDGRLGEVTAPVELVWGASDKLMTLDYAERLLDGLPRARLHAIEGCGHVPERECPDRFLAALAEALAEPPAPNDPVVEATAAETPAPQPDGEASREVPGLGGEAR